jgi:hypothetical protein
MKITWKVASLMAIAMSTACDRNSALDPLTVSELSGQWEITLYPTDGTTEDSLAVTHQTALLFDDEGQLGGYVAPFMITGTRRGTNLEIAVKNPDGADPLSTDALMQVRLTGPDEFSGVGVSYPHPAADLEAGEVEDLTPLTFAVKGRRTVAMSATETQERIGDAMTHVSSGLLGSLWSDICSVVWPWDYLLRDGEVKTMGACNPTKDGGGFYAFGRHAPGPNAAALTITSYIPVEWAYCDTRTYRFAFKYTGVAPFTTGAEIVEYLDGVDYSFSFLANMQDYLPEGTETSPDSLAVWLDQFKAKYGNFAFLTAHSSYSGWDGLYLITQSGNSDAAKDPIVKSFARHERVDAVLTGRTIRDTFRLSRASLPVCGSMIGFVYHFGTATVGLY